MDLGYPDEEPTEKDIGQTGICRHCHTTYEIV